MLRKLPLVLLPLAGLCSTSHADNCEAIASQIEAKLRASGLPAPRLITVHRGTVAGGRVAGSCANGSKQIVLVGGSAAAGSAPHAAPTDNIITECKDGRVVRGPDCSKPPPRPRPAASAASAATTATAATTAEAAAAATAASAASTP